jgi:MFS family permease
MSYLRGIYWRLAGVLTLVVLAALAANAMLSHRTFERALAPEMAKKIASVGASIRALVLTAVGNDIEFTALYGVDQRFDEVKNEVPEVSYIAITDERGRILHQRFKSPAGAADHFRSPGVLALLSAPDLGTALATATRVGGQYVVSMPIVTPQRPLGMVHIGVDVRFVDDIVLDMLLDVVVVLVVSLFFTLELLHFVFGARLEASLRALVEAFERGACGDFATRRASQAESVFDSLFQLMNGALARVNAAYAALARDIEHGKRVPAHERQPGLAQAGTGLQQLGQRFQFGDDGPDAASPEKQLSKVRAPLFVFILAEELTRPFLPSYVKELLVPLPGLAPEVVVGLPIALFMLIVALGQPFLGVYCGRVGYRRTMMLGAGIAAAGFVATALAASVLDLLLWRSVCALGYAMVFVAAQGYVLDHSTNTSRVRSFATFVGAIMAAAICGPSIGGILADNIGERPTFAIAALLALASIAVIRLMPESRPGRSPAAETRLPRLAEFCALLANARFMSVTALAAMPAKILLTGVCFYLVPLYVLSIGDNQAMAGRLLMAYAVIMVVISPLTPPLATTRERMHWMVGGGLIVSGLGGILMMGGGGVGWVLAAVMLVGLGQALAISAQSALVADQCEEAIARLGEGTVYGVYRLLERIGNALGPLIAGTLVLHFGYRASFVAIGAAVALCGAIFMLAAHRNSQLALKPA